MRINKNYLVLSYLILIGAGGRIPLANAIESASAEVRKMTKEDVRSLEGEKDVDCSEEAALKRAEAAAAAVAAAVDPPPLCTVDLESLRYVCTVVYMENYR